MTKVSSFGDAANGGTATISLKDDLPHGSGEGLYTVNLGVTRGSEKITARALRDGIPRVKITRYNMVRQTMTLEVPESVVEAAEKWVAEEKRVKCVETQGANWAVANYIDCGLLSGVDWSGYRALESAEPTANVVDPEFREDAAGADILESALFLSEQKP